MRRLVAEAAVHREDFLCERAGWTFGQIANRKLGTMIERVGYPGIAADLDVEKIASVRPALKKRAFEVYEAGERFTGHKGLPLAFILNPAST